MSLFNDIVNESVLLNELRTNRDDDIKAAINNVLRVRMSYDDGKDKVISKAIEAKNKNKENEYNYINLKDSEVKLLIVNYFIQLKDKSEKLSVIIAVPKFVDKYYFKLYGNVYSPLYQIVDGSTYNNSTSNSKEHSVTLKTMFMPIRIYRKVTN